MSAPIRLSDERGAYESAIISRYAEARQRLRGTPYRAPIVLVAPIVPPPPRIIRKEVIGWELDLLTAPIWKTIVALVAMRHDISVADIMNRNRSGGIVDARHEAIVLIQSHCDLSLTRIGNLFGIDHSSVIYIMRKAQSRPTATKPAPAQKPKTGRAAPPMDMLDYPGWEFLVHLVAFKRGISIEETMKPKRASRREAVHLITEHCAMGTRYGTSQRLRYGTMP